MFTTKRETQVVEELGKLKYFLGIEVAYSKQGIFLSQSKYIIDLLFETGRLSSKPMGTPIDENHRLCAADESPSVNKET